VGMGVISVPVQVSSASRYHEQS